VRSHRETAPTLADHGITKQQMSDCSASTTLHINSCASLKLSAGSGQTDRILPIERGIHALHVTKDKHGDLSAYADKVGRPKQRISDEVNAAEVYLKAFQAHTAAFDGPPEMQIEFLERLHDQSPRKCANFVAIHRAPQRMWPRLVKTMVDAEWTVEETRHQVAVINQSLGPRQRLGPVADRAQDHVSIAVGENLRS
jgi:hypothetical protein